MKKSLLDTIMEQIDLSNIIIQHESEFLESKPKVKIVPDELAIVIGVSQTMMLCQIDFLIKMHKDADHFRDDRYWIYETYEDWKEQFQYWSISKIRDTLARLEKSQLIITGNYNRMKGDNTKWYTINYFLVDQIILKVRENNQIITPPVEIQQVPPVENQQMHLSETNKAIPNISIPNKSIPNESKPKDYLYNFSDNKINGAFCEENAQHILDNNHIESIPNFMRRTRERIKGWDDVNYATDELCEAIEYFFFRYYQHFGENHPPLSPSDIHKVCLEIIPYLGEDGIFEMIDKYFVTESMCENSDLNILHFISEKILENRAYETGNLGAIPYRTFA